jgi:hypothetical protein
MNTSATNPSMQPKVLSMSAGPKRARFWKYSPFVFLLVAGMGAFALDRVLRESDSAPGSPIERGPQPTALWESTYDKARSNNRNGPSEKIPVGALAPDFRLTANLKGRILTFDKVDYELSAAVFDEGAYTRHVDTVFDRLHALAQKEVPVHA